MTDRHDKSRGMRPEAGFTLAETLIATVISTIVLLGLYLLYDVNQATFIRGEEQSDLQQNARIAMDRIVRELRLAGFDPQLAPIIPAPCATAIQSATAGSVSFIADVDSDGTTEKVEYTRDTTSNPQRIMREQWPSLTGSDCVTGWSASGGAQPLADRVTGLFFSYYDGAGNPLLTPVSSPDSIRRISVTIQTADTSAGSAARPFTLRAEVRPRNLGLSP